jgi:hypothetical protein
MFMKFIRKKMGMTLRKILTAMFDDFINALARLGCGLGGIPYEG